MTATLENTAVLVPRGPKFLENTAVMVPRGPKSLENAAVLVKYCLKMPGNTFWGEKPKSLEHNTEFGVVAASFNQAFALGVGPSGGTLQVG